MNWIVPAAIIGSVGGALDSLTELNKIWCLLIGVVAFSLFVFIKSIFTTARIMHQTKGKKTIRLDQDSNIMKSEWSLEDSVSTLDTKTTTSSSKPTKSTTAQ